MKRNMASGACEAFVFATVAVAAAFGNFGSALAAICVRSSSFHLTSEGPWNGAITTSSGKPCGGSFRAGGPIRFKRLYLATPPQNGTVSLREGGYYSYQSKPGYRGPDVFMLRICGTEQTAEGCANVRYSVTVE